MTVESLTDAGRAELLDMVEALRGVLVDGGTSEIYDVVYEVLCAYLGVQPVVVWDHVFMDGPGGNSDHALFDGARLFDMPEWLFEYLWEGTGPGPTSWPTLELRPFEYPQYFEGARPWRYQGHEMPSAINWVVEHPTYER